jgi:uncharacterized protein YpmS
VEQAFTKTDLVKYLFLILVPIIFLLIIFYLITLRRQVRIRTAELELKINELKESQEQLTRTKNELQESLDMFYTMRIGIQKEIESGQFEKENQIIKERLNILKKNSEIF